MSANAKVVGPEKIHKIQRELLDLLVEFDRICRAGGIRYFLSCGTLLGAIRHHGFIPWDDDADVEMLREDYERFVQLVPQLIDSNRFYFQDSKNDPNYNWPYGKLRKKGTRYVRPGQAVLHQRDGICIDIFVLDTMAPGYFGQRFQYFFTCLCRKVLWSPVGMTALKNPLARGIFRLLHLIPRETALQSYHRIAKAWQGQRTGWIGFFNTGRSSNRSYAYRAEWYEKDQECTFEGHAFNIPGGYDEILRVKYRDYMQLPPPEKRVGTFDAEYILFSDRTEYHASQKEVEET